MILKIYLEENITKVQKYMQNYKSALTRRFAQYTDLSNFISYQILKIYIGMKPFVIQRVQALKFIDKQKWVTTWYALWSSLIKS